MSSVLVVDDELGIREVVSLALAQLGVDVFEAASAQGALALLDQTGIDAVITDIRLPDMSGVDLTEKIRQALPDLPIIFMSAATSALFLSDLHPQGVWLEKPFKIQQLQTLVQAALGASDDER